MQVARTFERIDCLNDPGLICGKRQERVRRVTSRLCPGLHIANERIGSWIPRAETCGVHDCRVCDHRRGIGVSDCAYYLNLDHNLIGPTTRETSRQSTGVYCGIRLGELTRDRAIGGGRGITGRARTRRQLEELNKVVVGWQIVRQRHVSERFLRRTNNTWGDGELDQVSVVLDIAKPVVVGLCDTKVGFDNSHNRTRRV